MEKESTTRQDSQSTLSDAPSWIGVLSQVAPILSGVSSFGSFINSVVAARETAAFQQDLITSLQSIQNTLSSISSELGQIQATLEAIEADITVGNSINAIQVWSTSVGGILNDQMDLKSAQDLATAMLDSENPTSNLLGCMGAIHNAMVGSPVIPPLITQLPVEAFFQMRGILVQGLHLLAFATAFNTGEDYDYGYFLRTWSDNFQQETKAYLNSTLDTIIPMASETFPPVEPNGIVLFYNQSASDGIVQYQYLQPDVPNVSFQVTTSDGTVLEIWNDTLTIMPATSTLAMCSAAVNGQGFAKVDIYKNTVTYSDSSPWSMLDPTLQSSLTAQSGASVPQFYLASWFNRLHYYNEAYDNATPSRNVTGNLVCGARFNPAQVFLGGCNGQTLWVEESTRSVLAAIFEGTDLTGNILTYDVSTQTVGTSTLSDLTTLTGVLWNVSMLSQNVVTVQAQTLGSVTLNLQQNPDGTWSLEQNNPYVSLAIECPPAVPGTRGNPLNMAPTPVTIWGAGPQTSVLFYQF